MSRPPGVKRGPFPFLPIGRHRHVAGDTNRCEGTNWGRRKKTHCGGSPSAVLLVAPVRATNRTGSACRRALGITTAINLETVAGLGPPPGMGLDKNPFCRTRTAGFLYFLLHFRRTRKHLARPFRPVFSGVCGPFYMVVQFVDVLLSGIGLAPHGLGDVELAVRGLLRPFTWKLNSSRRP
jgi:hypothetical protein